METVYYSEPLTIDRYPELKYYAHCPKCRRVYIQNEYGQLYCSRSCTAVDETDVYVLMSVPANVPWKRRSIS
jgi:hypothetical protein